MFRPLRELPVPFSGGSAYLLAVVDSGLVTTDTSVLLPAEIEHMTRTRQVGTHQIPILDPVLPDVGQIQL